MIDEKTRIAASTPLAPSPFVFLSETRNVAVLCNAIPYHVLPCYPVATPSHLIHNRVSH